MKIQGRDCELRDLMITGFDVRRRKNTLERLGEAAAERFIPGYDRHAARQRSLGSFHSYPPEFCRYISRALNLLLTGMPRSMGIYKAMACALDRELCPEWRPLPFESSPVFEEFSADSSRLEQVSDLLGCDCSPMVRRLVAISSDPVTFLSGFTNLREFSLMGLVQKILALTPDFSSGFFENLPEAVLRNMLARKLQQLNCSRNYTHNVTHLSYRKLCDYYGPIAEGEEHAAHHAKYAFHEILGTPFQCLFVMSGISLYLMTLRSMVSPGEGGRIFSLARLPRKMSLPLAIGSYETVKLIPGFYSCRGFGSCYLNAVPGFEDYAAILEYVLGGRARVVGCARCDTPYLEVSPELADPRRPELCRHCCPVCRRSAEYLYDEEQPSQC